MHALRTLGVSTVICLLAAGLVRAAAGHDAAARMDAVAVLSATAHALGVAVPTDDPTPTIAIAAPASLVPGGTAELVATKVTPAGVTFRLRNPSLTIVKQALTGTTARLTLGAAANALPSQSYLEVVTPGGKTAGVRAAVVGGKWQIDVTAANGWRVRLTPADSQTDPSTLRFKAEFLKAGEAAAFETLDGSLELPDGPNANYSVLLTEASASGANDCARDQARMGELAQKMAAASEAEQERISAEFEKLQERMTTCMETQMAAMQEQMTKLQDPAYQKEVQAKQDNFGCHGLYFRASPDGAIEGTLGCGKNVGQQKVTGTMKYVGE
jgi:hypothetical protein